MFLLYISYICNVVQKWATNNEGSVLLSSVPKSLVNFNVQQMIVNTFPPW